MAKRQTWTVKFGAGKRARSVVTEGTRSTAYERVVFSNPSAEDWKELRQLSPPGPASLEEWLRRQREEVERYLEAEGIPRDRDLLKNAPPQSKGWYAHNILFELELIEMAERTPNPVWMAVSATQRLMGYMFQHQYKHGHLEARGRHNGKKPKRKEWAEATAEAINTWEDLPESYQRPFGLNEDQGVYRDGDFLILMDLITDQEIDKLKRSSFEKRYLRQSARHQQRLCP